MLRGQIPMSCLRQESLLDVPNHLFSSHDDKQLCGQLNQTAPGSTLNIKSIAMLNYLFCYSAEEH